MHKRWGIVVGSSWYIMCEFGGWCGGGKGLWGERSEPEGRRPPALRAGKRAEPASALRSSAGPAARKKKPPGRGLLGG